MKRILTLILCLSIACSLFTASTLASKDSDDIAFDAEGVVLYFDKSTGTITEANDGEEGANLDVTIPSEIEGVAVTTIGRSSFMFSDITKVTVPDSVTLLDVGAFSTCKALKTVIIGAGLKTIMKSVFLDCTALSDIYYMGTKAQWNAIEIDMTYNGILNEIPIHCADGDLNVTEEPETPNEPIAPEEPEAPETPASNPFKDVKDSDYFAQPVFWAVENGVTNGLSANSFGPNANCTRGQIVTFLWRASGSPEPTKTDNPFNDVKSSDYFYKAVLWAVEKGITTGLSATSFGPNATCTRGQVATFLYRAQGQPEVKSNNNPFSDVKTSDYYCNAVLWAVENDVTQGMGGGKFAPNASCTRGQIVTFLYRAIA